MAEENLKSFAVAYVYEDGMPAYDRLEIEGERFIYYKGDVVVWNISLPCVGPGWNFPKALTIELLSAESEIEAIKKVVRSCPDHIVMATSIEIPESNLRGKTNHA